MLTFLRKQQETLWIHVHWHLSLRYPSWKYKSNHLYIKYTFKLYILCNKLGEISSPFVLETSDLFVCKQLMFYPKSNQILKKINKHVYIKLQGSKLRTNARIAMPPHEYQYIMWCKQLILDYHTKLC